MRLRLIRIQKVFFSHNKNSKINQDIMKRKTKVIEFNDIKPALRVHLKLINHIQSQEEEN